MKFGVFTALLVSAIIGFASAQDPNTAGGQAGSVVSDPNTTQPTTVPPTAAPVGVNPGLPAPPAFAAPATQAPWDANPAPMTDSSGSGSFGSAGDIETPRTKKPKRVTESPSTPTPVEDSSASIPATTAWAIAGLALGLVAML
ncbi:hypothetical protein PInf_007856 [Phytophthora infestans]|nr:hypothetical protein PInf_007856 [Phytophthora infestans]